MNSFKRTHLSEVTMHGVTISLTKYVPKVPDQFPELNAGALERERWKWVRRCERAKRDDA